MKEYRIEMSLTTSYGTRLSVDTRDESIRIIHEGNSGKGKFDIFAFTPNEVDALIEMLQKAKENLGCHLYWKANLASAKT